MSSHLELGVAKRVMLASECKSSSFLLSDLVAEASTHDLFAYLLNAVNKQVLHLRLLRDIGSLGGCHLPDAPLEFIVFIF